MSDFITLTCPSCGGKLNITQNTQSLICQHCGAEHIVKRDTGTVMLESYARCPLCRRNDRVEKVSVVYSRQDALSNRVAPFNDPLATYEYNPEHKPEPIPQPTSEQLNQKFTNKDLKVAKILLICTIICFVIGVTLVPFIIPVGVILILLFVIGFILYLIFLIKGKIKAKKAQKENVFKLLAAWKNGNEKIEREWTVYITRYDQQYHQNLAELKKDYHNAMKRYELLYYCFRDDVVFIPGENIVVPSSELKDLCYQGVPE